MPNEIHEITAALAKLFMNRAVRFVQIGAADGKRGDPIYPLVFNNLAWSGMFVEPLPEHMEKLRQLHEDDSRFVFAQNAVHDKPGMREFWCVSTRAMELPHLPWWWSKVASFDRHHVESVWGGRFAPYIIKRWVQCFTLPQLIERHQLHDVQLLVIDAEGYDKNILRQIDWQQIRPEAIVFETEHMSNCTLEEINMMLNLHGFKILLNYQNNCLAMRGG